MLDKSAKQKISSFDELYTHALDSDVIFQDVMEAFVEKMKTENPEIFASLVFEKGSLKLPQEAMKKLYDAHNGCVEDLTDLVRGSLMIDAAYLYELEEALDANFGIAGEIEDRIKRPNEYGFRDRLMHIRLENGHVCEVQCHIEGIHAVRNLTKGPRKEAKAIDKNAEIEGRILTQ